MRKRSKTLHSLSDCLCTITEDSTDFYLLLSLREVHCFPHDVDCSRCVLLGRLHTIFVKISRPGADRRTVALFFSCLTCLIEMLRSRRVKLNQSSSQDQENMNSTDPDEQAGKSEIYGTRRKPSSAAAPSQRGLKAKDMNKQTTEEKHNSGQSKRPPW